jgi:hypothetical protein
MNNEKLVLIDSMLGCPNAAQVERARLFIESFQSSTEALVAMIAAMRALEQNGCAALVETVLEPLADLEADTM